MVMKMTADKLEVGRLYAVDKITNECQLSRLTSIGFREGAPIILLKKFGKYDLFALYNSTVALDKSLSSIITVKPL